MIAMCFVSIVAAIFLWPFAVAGIIAYFASGMRFNRWVSSGAALLTAIIWRLTAGEWQMRVGDSLPANWYIEIFHGILNWAVAAIFVSAFACWPVYFVEGYRSRLTSPA